MPVLIKVRGKEGVLEVSRGSGRGCRGDWKCLVPVAATLCSCGSCLLGMEKQVSPLWLYDVRLSKKLRSKGLVPVLIKIRGMGEEGVLEVSRGSGRGPRSVDSCCHCASVTAVCTRSYGASHWCLC